VCCGTADQKASIDHTPVFALSKWKSRAKNKPISEISFALATRGGDKGNNNVRLSAYR